MFLQKYLQIRTLLLGETRMQVSSDRGTADRMDLRNFQNVSLGLAPNQNLPPWQRGCFQFYPVVASPHGYAYAEDPLVLSIPLF